MANLVVELVQSIRLRDGAQLKLLLLFTLIATVGFAFPRLDWVTTSAAPWFPCCSRR